MNRSETIGALAAALAKAQYGMKNPAFDRTNPHFRNKYASLPAVRDAVVPALAANGISVVQGLKAADDGVECETMLIHASGEWISETLKLPVSKNDPQGVISSSTYARRVALQSMVCVAADDDDDGNAAVLAPPPAPVTDPKLLEAGRAAAQEGLEKYAAWWKALEPAQRTNIGTENHKSLKDAAAKVVK